MNVQIIDAFKRLERRIVSLYYQGPFTKAFAEEFKDTLKIIACFEYEPEETYKKSKVHSYLLPKRDVDEFLKKTGLTITELKKELEEKYQYFKKNNIIEIKEIKNQQIDNLKSIPREKVEIKTTLYIPIFVRLYKYDNKIINVYQFKSNNNGSGCGPETHKLSCEMHLESIIKIYSEMAQGEIERLLAGNEGSNGLNKFLEELQRIYIFSTIPCCFRNSNYESIPEKKGFCDLCDLYTSCGVTKEPDKNDLTNRITPDAIVERLFEICKGALPDEIDAVIAFCRYRVEKRSIQYVPVKYYKPFDDGNTKTLQELLEKNPEGIFQTLSYLAGDIFDTRSGEIIFGKEIEIEGVTYGPDRRILEFQVDKNNGKIDERDKSAKEFENLIFCHPVFIVMPVSYIGQLLGFIFVNFKPPESTNNNKQDNNGVIKTSWKYNDFITFKKIFYDISNEFAPDLFHALKYDFISGVIEHYTKSEEKKDIHEILLNNFPKILNFLLGCVWIPDENGDFKETPDISFGFKDNTFGKMEKINGVSWSATYSGKHPLKIVFSNNRPRVYELEYVEGITIPEKAYTIKNPDNKKIHLKTALLLPIKDKELRALGFKECVYVLFFEKTPLPILQIEIPEIMHEISGIFKVVMLGEKQKLRILERSMKAAIAATMSRNMSHNLGSHVLSYLTDLFNDFTNKTAEHEKGILYQNYFKLIKDLLNKMCIKTDDPCNIKNTLETILTKGYLFRTPLNNFIFNIKHLLEYLKERMDFIATIMTFIPSSFTMDFKKDIFMKINFDTELKSNGEYKSNSEIKYFEKLNLLLEYIAFSEKLNNTEIKREYIKILLHDNMNTQDLPVAIPGGIIGKQAFFTILENIIRNAAKHSAMSSKKDKMEFTIDFPDENSNNNERYVYDKDDLLRVTITDNMDIVDNDLVKKLQAKCDSDIINRHTGEFEMSDLGFKEMKFAAAFLRGIDPSMIMGNEVSGSKNDASRKLLTIEKSDSGNLVHSFFLLKPKEVLVIAKDINNWVSNGNMDIIKKFKNKGVDFVVKNENKGNQHLIDYNNFKEFHKVIKIRHRFVVSDFSKEDLEKDGIDIDYLPYRFIYNEKKYFIKNGDNHEKWIIDIYEEWIKNVYKIDTLPKLGIDAIFYNDKWKEWEKSGEIKINSISGEDVLENANVCLFIKHFKDGTMKTVLSNLGWDGLEPKIRNYLDEKNIYSIESITGSNSSETKMNSPTKILALELIESSMSEICIIDERIFRSVKNRNMEEELTFKRIAVYDLGLDNGVLRIIPADDKNYCPYSIEIIYNDITLELKEISKEDFKLNKPKEPSFTFVLIHQGIIDKITKKIESQIQHNENKQKIALKIAEMFKPLGSYVVIHSGRGKTEDIPKGTRFLNYPAFESWFMDDKHSLIQGLYAIRGR